ncbi:MAG TPA: MlaD family protein [Planctomycetota bacterium]|jgi:ABC-type transporter Mla subunit MlaD|nr:MlaD family protein [Planctomycetota bacterium]
MSAETKFFKLGAFVLAGVTIIVGTVIVLGAGTLMRKKVLAESYVDESVQGLDVGAPVKFRGVTVGRLEKIEFAAVQYVAKDDRIGLVVAFYPETLKGFGGDDPVSKLKELVDGGMRLRLASGGLTGGLYLELENFDPKQYPAPKIGWEPANPYLPSVPSTNVRLMARVENVLEHVEKMRVDVISDKVVALVDNLDKLVKTLQPAVDDVRKFTDEATLLVRDTRKVVAEDVGKEAKALISQVRETLEKDLGPALKGVHGATERLPATFDKLEATLDRVGGTLRRVDRTLAEDNGSIDETLDNLRVATQDLRELMGQVKRYPSAALFGEAPPKKEMKK